MRVSVDGIPSQGRRIEVSLATPWAREAAVRALEAPPTVLSGVLVVHPPGTYGRVAVHVKLVAVAARVCDRCAEDVALEVKSEVALTYQPVDPNGAPGEQQLSEEEMEQGWYEDGHVSAADVVTEALALAIPSLVVCADVPACDARTAAMLEATRDPASSPFAALRRTH